MNSVTGWPSRRRRTSVERLVGVLERDVDERLAEDGYQWLRRRPSLVGLSVTTSLTTSNATSGLVALPNSPYLSLRYSATLSMWSCSRCRRIAWSAALVGQRGAVVVLEEPGRRLAVPHSVWP